MQCSAELLPDKQCGAHKNATVLLQGLVVTLGSEGRPVPEALRLDGSPVQLSTKIRYVCRQTGRQVQWSDEVIRQIKWHMLQ